MDIDTRKAQKAIAASEAQEATLIRVGVFFGGSSSEREVSLESGRHLYQNLDPEKFSGTPIYLSKAHAFWEIPIKLLLMNTTDDIERALETDAQRIPFEILKEKIDFVLNTLHGKYGEDGCVQGLLELLDIPYNGSGVLASAIGMDKPTARRFMAAADIKTPRYIIVHQRELQATSYKLQTDVPFPLPWIVKPTREGCSTGLSKVTDVAELPAALERAWKWDPVAMIDEYIDSMEITTTVLGNDEPIALLPSETPPSGSAAYLTLEDKFLPGQALMVTPARLPEALLKKVQETSVAAYKALGLKGYARIDGFVHAEEVLINEVNTLPGATPSTCLFQQAAAAGYSPMDLTTKIIELGLEAHKNKRGPL